MRFSKWVSLSFFLSLTLMLSVSFAHRVIMDKDHKNDMGMNNGDSMMAGVGEKLIGGWGGGVGGGIEIGPIGVGGYVHGPGSNGAPGHGYGGRNGYVYGSQGTGYRYGPRTGGSGSRSGYDDRYDTRAGGSGAGSSYGSSIGGDMSRPSSGADGSQSGAAYGFDTGADGSGSSDDYGSGNGYGFGPGSGMPGGSDGSGVELPSPGDWLTIFCILFCPKAVVNQHGPSWPINEPHKLTMTSKPSYGPGTGADGSRSESGSSGYGSSTGASESETGPTTRTSESENRNGYGLPGSNGFTPRSDFDWLGIVCTLICPKAAVTSNLGSRANEPHAQAMTMKPSTSGSGQTHP